MSKIRVNQIETLDSSHLVDVSSLVERDEVPVTFSTVTDMDSSPDLEVGTKCRTLGYSSVGDGGSNDYEIVAASTGTDDGGSFIDLSGSGFQAKGLFPHSVVSVKQFGAVGDGVSNDSSSIQSTVDYVSLSGGSIFLPSGNYLCTSISITSNDIVFLGEGKASKIVQSGNTGSVVTISGNDCEIKDLMFRADSQRTGGSFITIETGQLNKVTNCHLRQGFNGITVNNGASIATIDGCDFQNFDTNGSSSVITVDTVGADITISECVFNNNASLQPLAGINVRNVQDITISGCNIIQCGNDLLVDPDTGDTVASLWSTNTFFDTAGTGINITNINGGDVVRCRFDSCWASSNTDSGVTVTATGSGLISGVSFIGLHAFLNGSNGLSVIGDVPGLKVLTGFFSGNTGAGISLDGLTSSSDISEVSSGAFAGVSGNNYGIYIETGCQNVRIMNNRASGNTTAQVQHNAKSDTGNQSFRNKGYNEAFGSAITVGASPFSYTASDRPETVYIEGGTVSGIEQAGVTVFTSTGRTVQLEPEESIIVTYSSAPFMNKIEH